RTALAWDGKGVWRDNVFFERLWKIVKYEAVCPNAYNTVSEARAGIARHVEFYNCCRPHSGLDRMTPEQFYFNSRPITQAA
ncbi:MAG: integrase core domain-containing protein, partial [Acidiferrobacterales bacterium]